MARGSLWCVAKGGGGPAGVRPWLCPTILVCPTICQGPSTKTPGQTARPILPAAAMLTLIGIAAVCFVGWLDHPATPEAVLFLRATAIAAVVQVSFISDPVVLPCPRNP